MHAFIQDLQKEEPDDRSRTSVPELNKSRTLSPKVDDDSDCSPLDYIAKRPRIKSSSVSFIFNDRGEDFFGQKCVRHKSVSG